MPNVHFQPRSYMLLTLCNVVGFLKFTSMMYPEIKLPPEIPHSKKRFQTAILVARWCTKYRSAIVHCTSTSSVKRKLALYVRIVQELKKGFFVTRQLSKLKAQNAMTSMATYKAPFQTPRQYGWQERSCSS